MDKHKGTYRNILKATSIFGGVQVFNILVAFVKSKIMAVFLGPVGVGINGLFTTAVGLIGVVTNIGLDTSAVKTLSGIAASDTQSIQQEVAILRRIVWFTGLFGALLTLSFSKVLSALTFDNLAYTGSFAWLSLAILFKQLTTGQLAVLQGFRRLRYLAVANLYGSFLGLLVAAPLYYYLRLDAIVPSIILSVVFTFLVNWWFTSKLSIEKVKIGTKEAFKKGKPMIMLGLSLSFITLLTTLAGYLLQIFISNTGGLQQVGLFTAGFALLNSYVGMIFNAMATDYFPRLAAAIDNQQSVNEVVGQQALVAVLVIGPIAAFLMALAPMVIPILYSKAFLPIVEMIRWGVLGMLVKAVSWSMGYILIARADSRLFMRTSLAFNSVFLAINVLGYHFFGLEGVGASFLVNHIIHFTALRWITHWRYGFSFDKKFYKIFIVSIALLVITFLFSYSAASVSGYAMAIAFALVTSIYSSWELDKRIGFKATFQSFINKRNGGNR